MGLTIHYRLTTELTKPKDVRQLVETMRQHALDLSFKEVGEVKEFTGEETDHHGGDEEDRWLKIQSSGHVTDEERHLMVAPLHIIAFTTWPGEASEPAKYGFFKYPAIVPSPAGGRRLRTKLTGWRWGSFCKTQYASDPKAGGVENFLRCHLSVVKMLDFLKQSQLVTVEVQDEGEYWDKRDMEALAKEVGDWNELIAGFVSGFRSAAEGKGVHAPITGFPNFEHLEAKGLERLTELRRRLKDTEP
jgi:hypothetical protein